MRCSVVRSRLIAVLAGMAVWMAFAAVAQAAPVDDFDDVGTQPFMGIFEVPQDADINLLSTEAGEYLALGPGFCERNDAADFNPFVLDTAWWRVRGNGRGMYARVVTGGFAPMVAVYASRSAVFDGGGYLACDMDETLGHANIAARWESVAGQTYYIQAGRCMLAYFDTADPDEPCHTAGTGTTFSVWVSSDPPPNDARAAATGMGATAQGDNNGATIEGGEQRNCDGVEYHKTAWFRHTAADHGLLQVTLGGLSGVVGVFRASDGAPLGCGPGSATARVARGAEYLIQVGGIGTTPSSEGTFTLSAGIVDPDHDGDGHLASADCRDDLDAVNRDRPEIVNNGIDDNCDRYIHTDGDRDGSPAERDCDDGDDRRKAPVDGGVEKRGNRVDEDCDQVALPFRRIKTDLALSFDGRLTMTLKDVPKRARLKITCSRCTKPTVKRRFPRARKRVVLSSAVLGSWSRGAVARADVRKPRRIGHRWKWRVTNFPRSVADCPLEPGIKPRC